MPEQSPHKGSIVGKNTGGITEVTHGQRREQRSRSSQECESHSLRRRLWSEVVAKAALTAVHAHTPVAPAG